MRLHTWNIFIWVFIILQFVAYEVFTLARPGDQHEPFTFYVRKIVGSWTSPVWYLAAGFIVWTPGLGLFRRSLKARTTDQPTPTIEPTKYRISSRTA